MLDLYVKGGTEAHRVLKPGGMFIVKTQDEVSANRQWLTHVEIINVYAEKGFVRAGPLCALSARTNLASVD